MTNEAEAEHEEHEEHEEEETAEEGGNSSEDAEIEARAKEMGWVPKDKFNGDKSRWTDARTFVKRGEEVLPIVNANLRKVRAENTALHGELQSLKTQLAAATEAIETLKQINTKDNLKEAKESRRELIRQRKTAEEEGNEELAEELEEKIHDATAAIRDAETSSKKKEEPTKKETPPPDRSALQTPEFIAWKDENPWFGTDKKRSDYAAFVITRMNADGEAQKYKGNQKGLLDEVSRRVFEDLGEPDQRGGRMSKVESGRNGTGKGGGGRRSTETEGRTYNDLPPDAKAACERTAKRVVGKGRAFENLEQYKAHYVKHYQWD